MMDRVRTQERIIMKLCVEQCKMPKKNFVTLFTSNETSDTGLQLQLLWVSHGLKN